ncbi:hypothetical protein HPB52_023998 [Rhipicephalus sanguineus]|uniref:Uncharacterized protein n=1 Tax=Rhipicephalus sanguineus TaxID=34632 RepID=A0A9D4T0M1_RHISA|nr:hypothetical protein HPB52_023998 [Rhipicephalus sanguineus]
MKATRCLPRPTPIATLRAEAQLNTIDEIVHQYRIARRLKSQAVPVAAALARYYNRALPGAVVPSPEIPPWLKAQASDNQPLTCLRQSNREVANEAAVTGIENSLAVYVDAAIESGVLHTSLDSTPAVRGPREVTSFLDIASDVHRLTHSCACPARVMWTRRSAPAQQVADAACHLAEVRHPLPLIRFHRGNAPSPTGNWSGPSQGRTRDLHGFDYHTGPPPNLTRGTHGPLHRPHLDFILET